MVTASRKNISDVKRNRKQRLLLGAPPIIMTGNFEKPRKLFECGPMRPLRPVLGNEPTSRAAR